MFTVGHFYLIEGPVLERTVSRFIELLVRDRISQEYVSIMICKEDWRQDDLYPLYSHFIQPQCMYHGTDEKGVPILRVYTLLTTGGETSSEWSTEDELPMALPPLLPDRSSKHDRIEKKDVDSGGLWKWFKRSHLPSYMRS